MTRFKKPILVLGVLCVVSASVLAKKPANDVNVVNTPTVVVGNTRGAPIPVTVQGADNRVVIDNDELNPVPVQAGGVRTPFYSGTSFVMVGTAAIEASVAQPQPGQMLVVEQVGIKVKRQSEDVETVDWTIKGHNGTRNWSFPLLFPLSGGAGVLHGSQSVRLYHDMNETLTFRYERSPLGPRVDLTVTVSGYTIPEGDTQLGP